MFETTRPQNLEIFEVNDKAKTRKSSIAPPVVCSKLEGFDIK
ncbi:MAG: hypothetical protein AABW73_04180 [Nanoarchaeota archaeon]